MKKQNTNKIQALQTRWDQAAERAAQEASRPQDLGQALNEGAGLHVKSGVEAGGLWGSTSCTCQQTCTCDGCIS